MLNKSHFHLRKLERPTDFSFYRYTKKLEARQPAMLWPQTLALLVFVLFAYLALNPLA